ncbi:Phenylalanine--tRNA ligase beta subunit [Serratia symbiotica]|nr:Phenylalanine--tRNA ligase beta subunit [Serratia symbiotica]
MKFSELWLREWIDPPINSEALSDQITTAGLEVNRVEPVAGTFQGVMVGEVVECGLHPNADKLCVTKVNIGDNHLLNIVCGAPNCRPSLKVAVATIGAILPGNFKIKATTLRGKLSEGMLCSFSELGIPEAHDGIIELPQDASIGTDIRDYLKLNDNTIEISVTPNRADCLSILGIARDISVLNHMALTKPEITPVATTIDTTLPIRIDESQRCPRYLARVVKGINSKASAPLWMREKLRRSGIRSINPVVDITNYVLLELGQPVNAFDLDYIEGGIVVRMAKQGECLMLQGGNEIKLNSDTLVIADHHKALAMGGVFCCEYSRVSDKTQDVMLECAFFNPQALASRARRPDLHTDASLRYERGVDPTLQDQAMERATRLLMDICGGRAAPIIDVTDKNELANPATIKLHRKKLDRLLGHVVPSDQVSDILHRLGCHVTHQDETWLAVSPSWRFDIKIEEDLIEEIVRIYGYKNVPNVPVRANLVMNTHPESNLTLGRIKTLLVDHGFQEAITYSFVNPKVQALLHPGEEALTLPNPISADMSAMRLSLWPGLLSAAVYNHNRQQTHLRLFESGRRFVPDASAHLGVRQDVMLAAVISGQAHDEHWNLTCRPVNFYDLKGELESVLELTGQLSDIQFLEEENPALHPGQSAAVYLHGKRIGFIGLIHPALEGKLDLKGQTLVFELEWNKLARRRVPLAKEISRFPANRRDIAVVVAEKVAAADILAECKKVDSNQVVGINLFDVYRGKGVPEGYKSLGISLILQDTASTLREEEIASTVAKCVEALRQRFQASLRD